MEKEVLNGAEKIMLGARLLDDGTWRSTMIVTYTDKSRHPYIGETPQVFATSDAAREWANQHVAPLLALIGDAVKPDESRPKGLHCTRYEWTQEGAKLYCGRPAQFHISLTPIAEDEFCCEEHSQELRSLLPPELKSHLRRIN